jgi:hypothetical protein
MGHFALPRLYFRGDFRTDVCTCNNDDIASTFPGQAFVDSASVAVDTLGMNDGDFSVWLRQLAPPFGIRAGWNLYGDYSCGFVDAKVHAVHPRGGGPIDKAAEDSFVGAAFETPSAVMVDLDPEGTLGTQIFCDEISVTKAPDLRIVGRPTRLFSRWVTRRNLAARGFTGFAATWCAAIPPDQLTIVPGNSQTLDDFRKAHDAGMGLFVRFSTYLLAPRISQQQLAQDFAINRPTHNPAFGKLVGAIGVWDPVEMTSIPLGRRLNPVGTLLHEHAPFSLNPAVAVIDRTEKRISVDLINAFPEIDESLEKVDVGKVAVVVTSSAAAGSQRHVVGEIAYDRAAYEKQGGMVDLPYTDAIDDLVDDGSVSLIQSATNLVLLDEITATIETDERCAYLQEHEQANVAVRLHQKGRAPGHAATIRLKQYVMTNKTFAPATTATAVVNSPDHVDLPATGTGTIAFTAVRPGTCVIAMLPPGEADSSLQFFFNVRVLPEDNFDAVLDPALTFSFVYQHVLRYYHLIYPAMSEIIDLKEEFDVSLAAQTIQERIAKSNWASTSYMPISRDLSDGKRKLLERWCAMVLGGGPSPPA